MSRLSLALILAAVAAYKSAEHLVVFGPRLWPLLGAPLLLGAVWTLVRPRAGMTLVALAALVVNFTPAYRNHLALLMWIAVALAVFGDERHERLALRVQLSTMYAFAAISKVWPDWLSGTALEAQTWIGPLLPEPLLVSVAWGAMLVEAALAYGVWSRWRGWIVMAALTHGAFIVFVSPSPQIIGHLIVFAALALAVWRRASSAHGGKPALVRQSAQPSFEIATPPAGQIARKVVQ